MNQVEALPWPPPYIIKKHRRARYVKLRISKPFTIVITVPYRFNLNEMASILEEKKAWITKQWLYFKSRYTEVLPDKITISMLDETWSVSYMACDAKLEIFQRPSHELVLVGSVKDQAMCKQMLIAWLKDRAKIYLTEKIKTLSIQHKLDFNSVTIRDQKSLWGSCTRDKAINLNYRLMFLPNKLAEHVIIHELCHTKHLNHSDKFWKLVDQCDPDLILHKRELRQADKYIPGWIY